MRLGPALEHLIAVRGAIDVEIELAGVDGVAVDVAVAVAGAEQERVMPAPAPAAIAPEAPAPRSAAPRAPRIGIADDLLAAMIDHIVHVDDEIGRGRIARALIALLDHVLGDDVGIMLEFQAAV